MTAAFVTTLVRPASWAFGLLGFLAGGGLVIVAWPILVLPTPTGLQNDLGGPVSRLVLGTPSPGLLAIVAALILGGAATLVLATLVGAWAELQGISITLEAAAEEGLAQPGPGPAGVPGPDPADGPVLERAGAPGPDLARVPGPGRIALVRLLSTVPVALTLVLVWGPIYDAAYHELILPDDLVTPLPLRVIRDVPWLIAGVAAAWLLSDAAGAIAVRRLVLERRPVPVAWLLGWADLARRPHRVVATALAGATVLVLLLGPVLLASGAGWAHVRDLMLEGGDPGGTLFALVTWVALWLGGLVLVGVAAAIRAAAWTFLVAGRPGA